MSETTLTVTVTTAATSVPQNLYTRLRMICKAYLQLSGDDIFVPNVHVIPTSRWPWKYYFPTLRPNAQVVLVSSFVLTLDQKELIESAIMAELKRFMNVTPDRFSIDFYVTRPPRRMLPELPTLSRRLSRTLSPRALPPPYSPPNPLWYTLPQHSAQQHDINFEEPE